MEFSGFVYAFFNVAEGLVWLVIACYLVIRRKNFKPDKVFWVLLAAPAFVVFAISDFIEAPHFATPLPHWLWAIKLVSGFIVFLCRVCYLDPHQKKERIETVLLGLFLLAIAIGLIFLF